eukprot:1929796-Amphidinium_carterae.1
MSPATRSFDELSWHAADHIYRSQTTENNNYKFKQLFIPKFHHSNVFSFLMLEYFFKLLVGQKLGLLRTSHPCSKLELNQLRVHGDKPSDRLSPKRPKRYKQL